MIRESLDSLDRRKPKRQANPYTMSRMVRFLIDNPGHSIDEIAFEIGLHRNTVAAIIAEFRDVNLVFIYSWGKDKRGSVTVREWGFGINKKDKTRTVITGTERSRRYRAKKASLQYQKAVENALR